MRAVGAHGEGMGTSIGGLGAARCGRSSVGLHESVRREGPEVHCWEAGTHMGHNVRGAKGSQTRWAAGQTGEQERVVGQLWREE